MTAYFGIPDYSFSYEYPSFKTYSYSSFDFGYGGFTSAYSAPLFNYSYTPLSLGYYSFDDFSYSSFSSPSYNKSYSFDWKLPVLSFGEKSNSAKSFELPKVSLFASDITKKSQVSSKFGSVTPRRLGNSQRPSFKSAEAARLYDPFMNKAKAFNPKTDLGPEFLEKVKTVAKRIDCDYKDLLAVMQAESGLNPYIPNQAGYGAYGLIQFQPATLRGLGSSPEKLLAMSPIEQLDLVEKHFLANKKAMKLKGHLNAGELYGLVLAPAYVKNSYFYKSGSSGYNANRAIDTVYGDGNGKIEKSDLVAYMNAKRVNENIFVA